MNWPNFTPELIDAFNCNDGRQQALYWDGACPSLGVRVTQAGAKSFIFEARVRHTEIKLRMTIGDVRTWSIDQAREKAKALKRLTDQRIDPRTGKKVRETHELIG